MGNMIFLMQCRKNVDHTVICWLNNGQCKCNENKTDLITPTKSRVGRGISQTVHLQGTRQFVGTGIFETTREDLMSQRKNSVAPSIQPKAWISGDDQRRPAAGGVGPGVPRSVPVERRPSAVSAFDNFSFAIHKWVRVCVTACTVQNSENCACFVDNRSEDKSFARTLGFSIEKLDDLRCNTEPAAMRRNIYTK